VVGLALELATRGLPSLQLVENIFVEVIFAIGEHY